MSSQQRFLMNHRDPNAVRFRRAAQMDFFPAPFHRPAVTLDHAGHDFHQGGLPRSVFANQSMHLTRFHPQITLAESGNSPEALLNAFQLE